MNKELIRCETPFDLFEDFFGRSPRAFGVELPHFSGGSAGWAPRVDVRETPEAVQIRAELPGVKKDEIRLEVKEGRLILAGETRRDEEKSENGWLRRETVRGRFYRAFELPADVDADKIEARQQDGILDIRLPKSERAKPRAIDIR